MDVASYLNFPSQKWDFGCGSWAFECFAVISNISMLLLAFVLGLKVFLQVGSHCKGMHGFLGMFRRKSSDLRNGFCSGKDAGDVSGPNKSFGGDYCKFGKVSTVFLLEKLKRDEFFKERQNLGCCQEERGDSTYCRNGNFSSILKARESSEEDEEKEEGCEGHEEDDVVHLKEMILIERERRNAVYLELEKERLAAASAANEAIAMIQRLQNEKNLIEMEARQYRSVAEQKQLYDQEVIRALQWIVSTHELERSLEEKQLKQSRRRLFKGNACDETSNEAEECHDDEYQSKDCETDRSVGCSAI
ncbi:protein FLOURY 1-like [Magnolia sinica]|uniref:protein FLOURY 1-like n=1 Tax=Magnolia sinica TaxID=86752 RepID=UPI00265B49B6|nr:protein FLOURY 1-like [Magnolia sinica]